MKRTVCLLVAVMLLIASIASADGYGITEIPIEMLGIDHYDKFLDAQVKLDSAQGFSGGYWELGEDQSAGMCIDVEAIVTADAGLVAMFEESQSASYYYAQFDSAAEVAGHELDQIALYFAYNIADDKTIDRNPDNGKFYAGVYTFCPEDVDGMYNDLLNKLRSVYGDDCGLGSDSVYKRFTDKVTIWSSNPSKRNCTLWDSSANDMWLILKSVDFEKDGSFDTDCVQIMYIWKGADQYIAQLKEIMKNERKTAEAALYGNNDTSGL